MSDGWITLHRKLNEWEWYTSPNHVFLFVHLLLKANHKEGSWRGHKYKRGDVLTSLSKIESETGLTKQNIRTILKNLKKTGEINTLPNTKLTHINICKYDIYQSDKDEPNTPPNTELTQSQHTPNTHLTTNNNDNKENKENNNNKNKQKIILPDFVDPELWKDFMEIRRKNKAANTPRAIKTLINILEQNQSQANSMLTRSIVNSWKSLFPEKNKDTNKTPNHGIDLSKHFMDD